jgi:predicted Zn-dependent protease
MQAEREHLDALVGRLTGALRGAEVLTASYRGEASQFVRFNGAKVRQAGSVRQGELTVELVDGRRHASATVAVAGDPSIDQPRLDRALADLRSQVAVVPEDPYLLVAEDQPSTERIGRGALPAPDDAVHAVLAAATGRDLAGVYAAGTTTAGFASSTGQRNWFESATFNLDWSFHLHADKAVKNLYAGTDWDPAAFARKVDWSLRQLEVLARPPMELRPDDYRTYLAPAAVRELVDMLAWGGFGIRDQRTRQTPLLRMHAEGATFAPGVRIVEDTAGGAAPDFQEQGFVKPAEVVLIDRGRPVDLLVSPRSAQEYGVPTNGAAEHEAPESVAMAPGHIPTDAVLDTLGTGLHVGNLWYLNFSDRAACRTTGMTRFATFWVEGGEVVAPVNVLRFDDTAFHLLGDHLVGLTDETELLLDPSTYGHRSTASARLPGALVEAMRFTL